MAKRSLKASAIGIARAKQAFQRREWTQEYLASAVGLQTRQSIWKFFSGRPIERHLFIDICFQLDLDWQDIAELPRFDTPDLDDPLETDQSVTDAEIQDWVQQVRSHLAALLQAQCGTLQTALDLAQPLPLQQVYTDVHLLSHLSSQRWLEVADLQRAGWENYRTPLTPYHQTSISALDAVRRYPRLMIVGKPGSGKTTFLQYLALQCNQGIMWGDRIAEFIPLRTVMAADPNGFNLKQHISQPWSEAGLTDDQISQVWQDGRVVLLLDGLDEVDPAQQSRICQQIQTLVDTYPQVQLILTCRLAAQDYHFQSVTCMEMADFDPTQIETFVHKWFLAMSPDAPQTALSKATQFLEQLQRRDHQPIRELAVTPILLHLACLVFHEREAFPSKRSRLYQSGLDILLVRWDTARGIRRDQVYHQLSVSDRMNILSQIAATMFEQGKLFFEKVEVVPIIVAYLVSLPGNCPDPETLWSDSEGILRAIALQNGLLVERAKDVYSFSHLTFQEYLTARKIFISNITSLQSVHSIDNADEQPYLSLSLCQLASHVTDRRWHEVIGLTAELLPTADGLVQSIQRHIDGLVQNSEAVQALLSWIRQKTRLVQVDYKPSAVRAFYLSLYRNQGLDLALAVDPTLTFDLDSELVLDLELIHALRLSQQLLQKPCLQQVFTLYFALDLKQRFQLEENLSQKLQSLLESLLIITHNQTQLETWCHTQGSEWMARLRQVLVEDRQIGQEWGFDAIQQAQIQHYYQAIAFLVQCLKGGARLSPELQIDIENNLLLAPHHPCNDPWVPRPRQSKKTFF